jgi:hypothetical protein
MNLQEHASHDGGHADSLILAPPVVEKQELGGSGHISSGAPVPAPVPDNGGAATATAQGNLSAEEPSYKVSPLEKGRDRAAIFIAGAIIFAFCMAVFLPAIAEMTGHALSTEVRAGLDKSATALIGLLGAVTAFYFSDKRLR